ncbi:hypothetical protein NDU88_007710 [Pleurodeles waltl]|uniref:Uncharacterized protein n=1 Tax=Pleurodeles waltl TaxID=8319 RepID=A0AAV7VQI2_PLEWA|nr:hypothetical protein NDU88_007710 [Pleurodeles waltl]
MPHNTAGAEEILKNGFLLFRAHTPGIGAGRHRSSWTQKTPRQGKKTPLLGGTERRQSRNRQKPWKTAADPGELSERATALQEKRGLSRYGVRDKGKRAEGGRPSTLKPSRAQVAKERVEAVLEASQLSLNPVHILDDRLEGVPDSEVATPASSQASQGDGPVLTPRTADDL